MLGLAAWRPNDAKVVSIDAHPTQPWIAFGDLKATLTVWDWRSQEVLYEVIGGQDEAARVSVQLQQQAERNPAYYGPRVAQDGPTKQEQSGAFKGVAFFDEDVINWRAYRWSTLAEAYAGREISKLEPFPRAAAGFAGKRWLVAAWDTKVLFLDLANERTKEIHKADLEGKAIAALEVVLYGGQMPCALIGGTDGVVRVFSLLSWQVVGRLAGGHKTALNCALAIPSNDGSTHAHRFITGCAGGTLAWWNLTPGVKDFAPQKAFKAHDGGVVCATLTSGAQLPSLITTGNDGTVAVWNLATTSEVARFKPHKLPCIGVASWLHPRCPDFSAVVITKEPIVLMVNPAAKNGGLVGLCDVGEKAPKELLALLANKSPLKAYSMISHPLQNHILFIGTNLGVAVLGASPRVRPPAILARTGTGQGSGMLYVSSNALHSGSFKTTQPAAIVERSRVASLPHPGYAVMDMSPEHKHLSLLWPQAKQFTILRMPDYVQIEGGEGSSFAWSTTRQIYAVLSSPTPQIPNQKPSKKLKGKAAEKAAAQARAAAEAARHMALMGTKVSVYDLPTGASKGVLKCEIPIPPKTRPVQVYHGALLGVSFAALPGETTSPCFKFYDFDGGEAVGEELPVPEWVEWDQGVELCAIGYANYVAVFACAPSFHLLGTISIVMATEGRWYRQQLFLLTPTSVECAFVQPDVRDASHKMIHRLPIASMFSAAVGRSEYAGMPTYTNYKRPIGCLKIGGVEGGKLCLIDAMFRVYLLPLTNPALQAHCLTAFGDIDGVIQVSSKLAPEQHDLLADFMRTMGYKRDALRLEHLSHRKRLQLALDNTDLDQALTVLAKIAEETQDLESSNAADALALESFADGTMDIPNKTATGHLADDYMNVAEEAFKMGNTQLLEKCLDTLICVAQHVPKNSRASLALLFAKMQKSRTLEQYLETLIKLQDHDAAIVAAMALNDDTHVHRVVKELGTPSEQALHAHSCGAADAQACLDRMNSALNGWRVTPN